jgi:hypothetical protein
MCRVGKESSEVDQWIFGDIRDIGYIGDIRAESA